MNREKIFSIWAPDQALWSRWAKPVLFANLPDALTVTSELSQSFNLDWLSQAPHKAVVILDLPGVASVAAGMAMTRKGYRPIPLFNSSTGPSPVLNLNPLMGALVRATSDLMSLALPDDAPPCFLLDANRLQGVPTPRTFDNRWIVFPQDFPSGNFLLSHGYQEALLIKDREGQPQNDLAHVLLRWQEAGIKIKTKNITESFSLTDLIVTRPSKFRSHWYRVLAVFGLRPNSAGGFGAIVPDPSQSSGWG